MQAMTESASTDNQSFRHDRGSVSQSVESFVETITSTLDQTGVPASTQKAVKQSGEQLVSAVNKLANDARQSAQRVETLQRRVAELSNELSEEPETRAKADAEVRSDLFDELDTPFAPEVDNTSTPDIPEPETGLGEIIRFPETVAEESLTENQQKARSVAKDVHQYATSVPAGYRIAATDLRRVLSTQADGATIHGQTLKRVRSFLTELGQDDVQVKESRGGTNAVIFTEAFLKRVVAWNNSEDGHRVVTQDGVPEGARS